MGRRINYNKKAQAMDYTMMAVIATVIVIVVFIVMHDIIKNVFAP